MKMTPDRSLRGLVALSVALINGFGILHVSAENATEAIQSVSPLSTQILSTTTRKPFLQGFRVPCSCSGWECGCCTGYILDRLNQKVCMNLTLDLEEFHVSAAINLNGKPLYKNTISGKNPPPMCIRLPRFRFIKFCVQFSNIYIANRNIHLCIDAEANWEDITLVEWSFDCVRMGVSGVAVVAPEDGGGIPGNPLDAIDQTNEDYDDSARENPIALNRAKFGVSKKIIFHRSLYRIQNKSPDRSLISIKRFRNGDYFVAYLGKD
ncbi:uncharacterized protein LOC132695676 [Cylas formicarius]|uniref:uncharacterized protein LOC132695676 n=1 Tax=Cylas formicarius TaxID=197179 RepID=UPI002958B15E|nr:uncharacterized protein LOC132695676 [Cylas formicarius]